MRFILYVDCITSCIRCCKVTCVNNNEIVCSRAGGRRSPRPLSYLPDPQLRTHMRHLSYFELWPLNSCLESTQCLQALELATLELCVFC